MVYLYRYPIRGVQGVGGRAVLKGGVWGGGAGTGMHQKGTGPRGGPRGGSAGGWRGSPKRLGAVTVGYKTPVKLARAVRGDSGWA